MRGKLSMRPSTTAAERADEHGDAQRAARSGSSATPARRKTVMNASTVVMTHTVVWTRPTGTPSVDARSERSAAARIAMPIARVAHEAARARPSTIGTTMKTIRSLSSKKTPPMLTLMSNGGFSVGRSRSLNPNQPGMNSASAVSSCATPIVATVRTSRGARQNRLMNVRSTTKPRKIAPRSDR